MVHSIITISKIAEICPDAPQKSVSKWEEKRERTMIGRSRAEGDEHCPEDGHYSSLELA